MATSSFLEVHPACCAGSFNGSSIVTVDPSTTVTHSSISSGKICRNATSGMHAQSFYGPSLSAGRGRGGSRGVEGLVLHAVQLDTCSHHRLSRTGNVVTRSASEKMSSGSTATSSSRQRDCWRSRRRSSPTLAAAAGASPTPGADGSSSSSSSSSTGDGAAATPGSSSSISNSSIGSGGSSSSSSGSGSSSSSSSSISSSISSSMQGGMTPEGAAAAGDFCIIEGPNTLQDFARMQVEEIRDNITSRRNRIFLLMEEIRRLRIQQRIKGMEQQTKQSAALDEEDDEILEYPSSIPFFPPLTAATLKEYYAMFATLVGTIILFGGLVAPTLELRLGVGGTTYADFINNLGLPTQLSQVDPIVASFSGGAVGVLSALLMVEVNNVKQQEHKKCMYCHGTGYLTCARCTGSGVLIVAATDAADADAASSSSLLSSSSESAGVIKLEKSKRCSNCAGSAKVMCPTCLCTGMALATEHDPRIDPF